MFYHIAQELLSFENLFQIPYNLKKILFKTVFNYEQTLYYLFCFMSSHCGFNQCSLLILTSGYCLVFLFSNSRPNRRNMLILET